MAGGFKFDEIGTWSEIKLDIIQKYGSAYTKTFDKHTGRKKYYIDAFSGAGSHISKSTGAVIEGSPARALNIKPPFDYFYFIDMDDAKAAHLKELCRARHNVKVMVGDASHWLIQKVLPPIQYENFNRALCLLDPYGLHLDWQVLEMAGKSRAVDMFLNFPVMDMNRNAIWHELEGAPQEGIERMNRFWGDDSWRKAAYADSPQFNLFTNPDKKKQSNNAIVAAFRDRLKKVAGFSFVSEALPMKNKNNAVVYYLILASQKYVALEIITDIFRKYK
jgi:three-Cys-motif partner protein